MGSPLKSKLISMYFPNLLELSLRLVLAFPKASKTQFDFSNIFFTLTKIYQSYKKFQRWRHLNWRSLNFILLMCLCFLLLTRLLSHSHTCRNNLASDTTSLVDHCPSHESCKGPFKLLPINDCMLYKGMCVGTTCLQRKPWDDGLICSRETVNLHKPCLPYRNQSNLVLS